MFLGMETAIYTRISSDPTGQKAGVARQERECRALVDARGWTLTGVYSDNDHSAYSGKPRPEYDRLLADIEAGTVKALVAWHPDRLHRSLKELEKFIDIVEAHGVAISTVQGGEYDLSTASGRMVARIVGSVSRGESEHKSERHKAKALDLARAGVPSGGGDRPFGYEHDRVTIRESEAVHIKDAAARVLSGESLKSVVKSWNESGVKAIRGGTWTITSFRRVIGSPRIAGLREYQGEVIGEAVWGGIITPEDHYAINAILDRNGARLKRSPRKYLLTGGVAVCGLCGADLVARPKADGRRCYVCASDQGGCGKIRILAGTFEDHVRDAVIEAVSSPALAEAIAEVEGEDTSTLLDEITRYEDRLSTLATDYYSDEIITRSEYLAAKADLDAKIEALRDRMITSTRANIDKGVLAAASPDALREAYESHDLAWRRRFVSLIVEKVSVGPAVRGRNFFDPDRVTIRWRA